MSDVFEYRSAEALLRPRAIALVGASESAAGGWSKNIFDNMRALAPDVPFYPINPRRDTIWNVPCYPSFAALPKAVDLALIITPANTIAATLREGVACGLKAATIYAAGFGEGGDAEGVARAEELSELTRAGLRLCGPNCMGTLSLTERLYLYPAPRVRDVGAGEVGLVMQSGGVFQFWTQYAATRGLGLSYAVSSGNELDLDLADYLNFMADDPGTKLMCVLAEGIKRPHAFMAAAAKALAARKPIVMMKIGRSDGAKAAAQSHTGALAGDDRVFDAVCERYGIVRVASLDDMIETALAFRSGRVPEPGGMAMFVGYSGSARGMILDAAEQIGLDLADLTPETSAALAPLMDVGTVAENPIDLGPMASRDPERYSRIRKLLLDDPNVALLAVQGQLPLDGERADPAWLAGTVAATSKPVFAYARTHQNVLAGSRAFQAAAKLSFIQGIPNAVRAAQQLIAYSQRLARPVARPAGGAGVLRLADDVLAKAGIAAPASAFATSIDDAVACARRVGFPVAMKLHSPLPIHKTEAGGVRLGLRDAESVAAAANELFGIIGARPELGCDGVVLQEMVDGLELIVGMRIDPQYGPIALLGLGGIFVEAFDDLAMRLLPLDATDVRAMLAALRGRRLLDAFRGRAERDVDAVVSAVTGLSDAFLQTAGNLVDLEINPLTVLERGRGVRAVDVRAVYAETDGMLGAHQ